MAQCQPVTKSEALVCELVGGTEGLLERVVLRCVMKTKMLLRLPGTLHFTHSVKNGILQK